MADIRLQAVLTAKDEMSKTVKSASGSFGIFADAAKKAAQGALVVGAGLVAAAGFAIKSSAEMQELRSSFDTLTGSAEKGAEVFQKLSKMAASTPFETTDLAKATQTMLAFGVSTEDSFKYLRILGDISLGNKEKLQGLSLAFSQVQSTGRLMGQDLLQMINQGFNPLTIIAQKTGKSVRKLKEEMEKGNISFQMVADAFETATSQGGLFFQGMERGSKTFNGTMSTLRDNISSVARSVVGLSETGDVVKGGLFDKVSQAINVLISWIDKNKQAIIDFVSGGINFLINTAGLIIGKLSEWIEKSGGLIVMVDNLKRSVSGFTNGALIVLRPILEFVINQFNYLRETFNKNGIGISVLRQALLILAVAIVGVVVVLGTIIGVILRLTGYMLELAAFSKRSGDTIVNAFKYVAMQVSAAIQLMKINLYSLKDVFQNVSNQISSTLQLIKMNTVSLQNAFRFLSNHISAAMTLARINIQGLWSTAADIFNRIAGLFNRSINLVIGVVIPSGVKGAINSLIGGINRIPGMSIPMLAKGGIVNRPTLAMIGEAGPEAVVPLNRMNEMGGRSIEINFNGDLSIRNDNDLDMIIKAVKDSLNKDFNRQRIGG